MNSQASRRRKAHLFVAIAMLAVVDFAQAETSAWQQRIEPDSVSKDGSVKKETPAKDDAKKAQPAGPKVKSQAIDPKSAPTQAIPGAASAPSMKPSFAKPLGPATTAPAGSTYAKGEAGADPAYEAFDQGQYLTALKLAELAAKTGDPQAHTLIARIYAEGLGVPQSPETAAQWYAKGIELGDTEAAFGLGVFYAEGRGVKQDFNEASRLFEMAAATGHVLANYNLGLLFLRGKGKPENPHRAFKHIEYSAERGIVAAQFDLAALYSTGTGTANDAWEAARWLRKAANSGHTEAELQFAVVLFAGLGTAPDQELGAKFFRSAAEKGLPLAQNRLGRCYAYGKGVPLDTAEASKWYLIAKANGLDDEVLADVYKKLSKTDRLKAEKAAEDWRDRSLIQ